MTKKDSTSDFVVLIIILTFAGASFFLNLGDIPFWQDEGETAVVSSNLLENKIPVSWDGKNLVSSLNGADFNSDFVWTWHPWVQFYVTAASFWVLGKSTFAGRIPFALCGFFTVWLLYFVTVKLTDNKRIGLLATFFLATNLQFILFCRQCRYYALLPLFTLLMVYAVTFLETKKGFCIFACSAVLLFHSNYASFPFIMFGLFCYLVMYRDNRKLKNFFYSLIPIVLLTVPWFIYAKAYLRKPQSPSSGKLHEYIVQLTDLLYLVNQVALPLLLMLPAIYFLFKRKAVYKNALMVSLAVVLPVIFLLPFVSYTQYIVGMRYATGIIPLLCLIGALSIVNLYSVRKWFGISLFLCFILTDLLVWIPAYGFRLAAGESGKYKIFPIAEEINTALTGKSVYADFFYEIMYHFKSPIEGISDFLNSKSEPGDVVLTNYERDPLIFYTGRRMAYILSDDEAFCNSIPAAPYDPSLKNKLPDYIFSIDNIGWIVERSNYPTRLFDFNALKERLEKEGLIEKVYKLDYPDLPWSNREDIRYHKFKTPDGYPQVTIFKLRRR